MAKAGFREMAVVLVLTAALLAAPAIGANIVGISVPEASSDAGSYALTDDVWSVRAPPFPLDINTGIGFIVNPEFAAEFSLHDHVYVAPYPSHVPDPARAVVTYEFSEPVVVDQIEVIQHTNGVTRIEGFAGDSLESLVSVGSVFGPYGDVEGWAEFDQYESHVFDLDDTEAGRFFRFVIRKTSAAGGYATYQVFPRDAQGVRFPPAPEIPLLLGDANRDGVVGIADLATLADHYAWPGEWKDGDFNNDGTVGIADLAILADNYGRNVATEPVPEPSILTLLAVGGIALVRGRRIGLTPMSRPCFPLSLSSEAG